MEGSWRGEGGARARVRRGEAKTKKERANGVQSAGRGGQAGEAVRAGRGLEGERPFFGTRVQDLVYIRGR